MKVSSIESPPKKYAYVISAFLSGTMVAISIVCGCYWETNDDPTFAWLLSRANNTYAPFIGRICSYIVHFLYMNIPGVSWWPIVQYICIFAGLAAILTVILKRYPFRYGLLITLAVCCVTWNVSLKEINFTRTAAIAAIGGCALIADAIFPECGTTRKSTAIQYTIGSIVMLMGLQIRSTSVVIALSMLASFGLVKMIEEGFSLKQPEIRKWLPKITMLVCASCVFLAGIAVDRLFVSEEERSYEEYNSLRSSIEDYAILYRNYSENGENLSKADLDVFLHWYSEDTEVFTEDKLKATIESGQDIKAMDCLYLFRELVLCNWTNCIMILMCAILYFLLSLRNYKKWLRGVFLIPGAVGVLLMLYLIYKGRLPARVSNSVVYGVMICYCLLVGGRLRKSVHQNSADAKVLSYGFTAAVLCVVLITVSLPLLQRQTKAHGAVNTTEREVLDYINEEKQKLFFFLPTYAPVSMVESVDMWHVLPSLYCENLFYLGGWDAHIPYKLDALKDRQIHNPNMALIERTDTYVVHNKLTTEFLRRHYGEQITESEVEYVKGVGFVQYSKSIQNSAIEKEWVIEAVDCRVSNGLRNKESGWNICGEVHDCRYTNDTVYCNVTTESTQYTYKLYVDKDGRFDAFFYNPNDKSLGEIKNMVFFKKPGV